MVMPFLLSAVPGDVAAAIGGAGLAGFLALWRRIVVLEGQAREDFRAGTDAMRQQTVAVENLSEKVDALVERLAS